MDVIPLRFISVISYRYKASADTHAHRSVLLERNFGIGGVHRVRAQGQTDEIRRDWGRPSKAKALGRGLASARRRVNEHADESHLRADFGVLIDKSDRAGECVKSGLSTQNAILTLLWSDCNVLNNPVRASMHLGVVIAITAVAFLVTYNLFTSFATAYAGNVAASSLL